MEAITYENCSTYIDGCSLEEKISLVVKLADEKDNRLYCRAMVKIIFEYQSENDFESIDKILLASFNIKRIEAKIFMLRDTYSARKKLKYWHNLRDNAHTEILSSQGNAFKMRGLFKEVRN